MTCHSFRFALMFALVATIAPPAQAAPIVAGATVIQSKAFQDITLLPGTPFNPTGSPIVLDDLRIGRLTGRANALWIQERIAMRNSPTGSNRKKNQPLCGQSAVKD